MQHMHCMITITCAVCGSCFKVFNNVSLAEKKCSEHETVLESLPQAV